MSAGSGRWAGHKSDFQWEEDALKHVRDLMPDVEPYRAWNTFTFTGQHGHVREVDLLIATPGGLFLVEIKSHPGEAVNEGAKWIFRDERIRTVDNPFHFTDQKAKELKGRLEQAVRDLKLKITIPWIQPAVFLSAPNLDCRFDDIQKVRVYGRQGVQTGLPGIWDGLHDGRGGVTSQISRELGRMLAHIGIAGLRRRYKVGPYQLDRRSFDDGPTWTDFLATNTALPSDEPRRVRVYLSELGATEAARESTRRAAHREYLALQGINHEGIVTADMFSDEHDAGPAIVFKHGKEWQRLDDVMAARSDALEVETRVEMIRQLAEAIDHAHRRHLYHRALAARCVWVAMDGRYPRLKIADWQAASRPQGTALGSEGTSLAQHLELSAAPYLAPEFGSPDADGVLLDIFGLGALSHLILTGQPPAEDRAGLGKRLQSEFALVPSAVSDSITPSMDDLVRNATLTLAFDRFENVRQFLERLDVVEAEIADPGEADRDPLEAVKGSTIGPWTVEKILGKGSTARAFLTTTGEVLKIALSDSSAARLLREANQLRQLHDSHIVQLLGEPREIGGRTLIVLECAGERTLAEHLRHEGRLGLDELESLGDHLLDALIYLDDQGVWHRDIKPENIGVKELNKKARRLVLFDFSLSDTSESATRAGTPPYLDPFIGEDRRPYFDKAAEWYSAAVTLHHMASGDLPSWDGGTAAGMLPDETPQLAESAFNPVLRDRLVAFFEKALHREVSKRFPDLRAMRRSWADVFRDLDKTETMPDTFRTGIDDPSEQRDAAALAARMDTPIQEAGLTSHAQSVALHQLQVATVGELIRIPASQVMRLRGVGLGPKNELVRRSRQWRRALGLIQPAPGSQPVVEHDMAHLTVEEAAEQLVPKLTTRSEGRVNVVRLALRLPIDGTLPSIAPWSSPQKIAEYAGLDRAYVSNVLVETRERWAKTIRVTTVLRKDVAEILREHGRVLEIGQVAVSLLARRGSGLEDEEIRHAHALACVRAAIETELKLDNPKLMTRRREAKDAVPERLLVAVSAVEDKDAPSEAELLHYAVKLGETAEKLVNSDQLLSAVGVVNGLRRVEKPQGMVSLSDKGLVALAGAASRTAAVSPRLELYPRDLDPERALRRAQIVGYLGAPGVTPEQLIERLLARFPELTTIPEPAQLRSLLARMGYSVQVTDGRYVLPTSTKTRIPGPGGGTLTPLAYGGASQDETWQRLEESADRGGFLVLKVGIGETIAVRNALHTLPQVTALDVTSEFVRELHEIRNGQGWPEWGVVVAADVDDAAPDARAGFGIMVTEALRRLEQRIHTVDGVVLLTDATPFARYTGGLELLGRLAARARQSEEGPHALWLLSPMSNPKRPPTLDGHGIGVMPGDAEHLTLPSGFAPTDQLRRVS